MNGCWFGPHLSWYKGPVNRDNFKENVLMNKVIVLDPGHGGKFDGAVGKNGLREKDINLKAALILAQILENSGARVFLTRTEDRDFLEPGQVSLKKDLENRIELANRQNGDLFISMHHNASGELNRKENICKTFYKMGDYGPSLDAAEYVHEALAENLGILESKLLAGNYHVLRNSSAPALLGEPSYISNPKMEKILMDTARLSVEAQAYFQGICKYFARGIPKITRGTPRDTINENRPLISAELKDEYGFPGILQKETEMFIDGDPVKGVFEGGFLSYVPEKRLCNGRHIAEVRCKNILGNHAAPLKWAFYIDNAPASIRVTIRPQKITASTMVMAAVTVFDFEGFPVSGSYKLGCRTGNGLMLDNGDTADILSINEGSAEILVKTKSNKNGFLEVRCGSIRQRIIVPYIHIYPVIQGKVLSQNRPIEDCSVIMNDTLQTRTSGGGWFSIENPGLNLDGYIKIQKNGYNSIKRKMTNIERNRVFSITPVEQGILLDKKIMIDPAFGGSESGGIIGGKRASDLCFTLAEKLGGFLVKGGALIYYTRDNDKTVTLDQRVNHTNENQPDYFISITIDSNLAHGAILHYPGSYHGTGLAKSIGIQLGNIISQEYKVSADAEWMLQQTPCPALKIMVKHNMAKQDDFTISADNLGYAVYMGILDYLYNINNISIQQRIIHGNISPPGYYRIIFDNYLEFPTDSKGKFRIICRQEQTDLIILKHMQEVYCGKTGEGDSLNIILYEKNDSVIKKDNR
ncbi:MAG: N-acetylmuramoyl-L-alanine amidase [bacterium]